jgi:hypothetical protein
MNWGRWFSHFEKTFFRLRKPYQGEAAIASEGGLA